MKGIDWTPWTIYSDATSLHMCMEGRGVGNFQYTGGVAEPSLKSIGPQHVKAQSSRVDRNSGFWIGFVK